MCSCHEREPVLKNAKLAIVLAGTSLAFDETSPMSNYEHESHCAVFKYLRNSARNSAAW